MLQPFRTFVRKYTYVRNPKPVATPVRKYTYPDGNQNMGASNGHFTVFAAAMHHELYTCTSRASCLASSICEAGRPNQCQVGNFRHVFFLHIWKG